MLIFIPDKIMLHTGLNENPKFKRKNRKKQLVPISKREREGIGPAIRRYKRCNFYTQTLDSSHNSADDVVIFTAQHNFPHNFVIKITLYSHKPMQPMFVTAR